MESLSRQWEDQLGFEKETRDSHVNLRSIRVVIRADAVEVKVSSQERGESVSSHSSDVITPECKMSDASDIVHMLCSCLSLVQAQQTYRNKF